MTAVANKSIKKAVIITIETLTILQKSTLSGKSNKFGSAIIQILKTVIRSKITKIVKNCFISLSFLLFFSKNLFYFNT